VLPGDEIVEVENVCPDPKNGFDIAGADLIRYGTAAIATWHTHPESGANLSVGDHESFLNYPDLAHYIIGNDGIRRYTVADGRVMNA